MILSQTLQAFWLTTKTLSLYCVWVFFFVCFCFHVFCLFKKKASNNLIISQLWSATCVPYTQRSELKGRNRLWFRRVRKPIFHSGGWSALRYTVGWLCNVSMPLVRTVHAASLLYRLQMQRDLSEGLWGNQTAAFVRAGTCHLSRRWRFKTKCQAHLEQHTHKHTCTQKR